MGIGEDIKNFSKSRLHYSNPEGLSEFNECIWEFTMNEFDGVPELSADEILCYLGLGMLACGMVEGLLFAAVPLMRWLHQHLRSVWSKRSEVAMAAPTFAQLDLSN